MFQAWEWLVRLKPSEEQLLELHHFRSLPAEYAQVFSSDQTLECPSSWFKPQRPLSPAGSAAQVSLTLNISVAQLTDHLNSVVAVGEDAPDPSRLSVAVDFKGLRVALTFSSENCGERKLSDEIQVFAAFVSVHARLPRRSSDVTLMHGIPCTYAISIKSNVPGHFKYKDRSGPACLSGLQGFFNFPQTASGLPGDPLQLSWWEPFIVDGNVRLTAEFTDKRSL